MKRLISLLLLFCIGLPLLAQQQRPAQTPKRDQKKKEVAEIDTIPLYNGTYVGVDLYGVGSKLLGGDFMSSEVSVAVNLKNKFIPTIEFGMGGTDTWSETGIHYKSKMAPFFRIGVDYNTMAKKKEKNSYLYAGLRYAFSSFKYDVSTMPADDPIWGDVIGNPSLEDGYWGGSVPFSHLGMNLESFKEEECCKLFNPANPKVVLTMAIATSIDALAIGISFAFLGVQDYTEILPPISIIGFVSFVMSLIGLIFGIQCGCGIARKLKAELWGGIILVIIGLKILIEHLFLQ